jgi:uncharacterized repeat protein (TIGR01451 family)
MSNLLWKFVALAGVAGVGFMVLLQTMESMSVQPKFAPQQAAAGPQEQSASQPEPRQAANDPFPPFRTKETVTLAAPFPSEADSNPGPAGDPFSADSFPMASKSDAMARAVSPAAHDDFGQPEFPEFPPLPPPEAVAESDPSAQLPDLPVLIPMVNETESPDIEAFSEESPFTDPPSLTPPRLEITQADPFSDPVPPSKPEENESEPTTVPFDPYEPLPDSSDSNEPGPNPEFPQESPVLFPPAEEATTPPENPPAPRAVEAPAPEFPAPAFPEESPASALSEQPKSTENNGDFPPFTAEPPKTRPSPGRASVQIPLAPPAEDEPEPVSDLFNFEPDTPEPGSSKPKTTAESTPPRVKPLPGLNFPEVHGPEPTLSGTGPECAVPLADGDSPKTRPLPSSDEPFADPLDQLTYPGAAPPIAAGEPPGLNFPTETKPIEAAGAFPQNPPETIRPEPGASPLSFDPRHEPQLTETPAGSGRNQASPAAHSMEDDGEFAGVAASGPQQPELKIEKTAPPKAALGQPMIYNILVRNVGASAAHEVIVEDQVPKGTQLTGTIPRGEMAENKLIWRLGIIQPGEEKKIAVRVIPIQEGQIGSVAKVSFVAEVAAKTVVAAAKLDLEFTGPAKVVLGDPVTYHFKLANIGTGDASNVYLRNILPEGLNHPDGNDLEYEVGMLKAGEVKEIDLTVNAAKAGDFTNKAVLSANGGLQKEAAAPVKIIGDRLVITRTGPKRRYVGRTATYSNTVVNQSDAKISPVHVVEVVPAGMEFVEASAGGRFDPQKRTVTWAIQELAPNQNQLLKLDLLAKQEGPQASEVIAYDPNGTRVLVKSETAVEGYTSLRMDVREYAEPVDVGEQVGLRVVATNKGTKASTKVIVKMTIPEEMELVSAQGPVDFKQSGATLTFNPVESLAAGEELEFDLVLKSIKPGDSRVRLEITSDQTEKPLAREEGIRILSNRP